MPFRLREDAKKWFRELDGKGPTKHKFDLYYFCLMAGLASNRRRDLSELDAPEIVTDFIQDYKPSQLLLIGLLVDAEVRRMGIDLLEKDDVRSVFKRLVTLQSGTQLTDEGMRCMNEYASGGYDFLSESRANYPESHEEFLRDFTQLIAEAIDPSFNS